MLVEISRAIAGLLRLVRFDASGLDYFDRSIQGFWRSFRVALLILPAYAVLLPLQLQMRAPTAGWGRVMMVELLVYIIAWLAFPVVAYEICRRIGRLDEYVGYIVVYNWSSFVAVAVTLLFLTFVLSPLGPSLGEAASYAALAFMLMYTWYISRIALRIDGITAILFTAIDFGLGELLDMVAVHMEI